jgi:hypothetical protein
MEPGLGRDLGVGLGHGPLERRGRPDDDLGLFGLAGFLGQGFLDFTHSRLLV